MILEADVHDLALDRCHRVELDRLARGDRLVGAALGQRVEARLSARAVPGRVYDHGLALVSAVTPEDRVREVLDRVDRLAVLADQEPQLATDEGRGEGFLVLPNLDAGTNS